MRAPVLLSLLVFVVLSVSASVGFAAGASTPRRGLTAFVLSNRSSSQPDIVVGVESALLALNRTLMRESLLLGDPLHQRLGSDPVAAASVCEASASCLSRLGAKLGVDWVAFGRMTSTTAGVTLQVTLVDVSRATQAKQTTVKIASVGDVNQQIATMASELFGVDRHMARGAITAARKNALANDPLSPLEPVAAPTPVVAPQVIAATPAQSEAPRVVTRTEMPPKQAELTVTVEEIRDPPWWRRPTVWRYTGVGLSAVGLGCLAWGAVSGSDARAMQRSVVYGTGGTTQLSAERKQTQANASVRRANTLFVVGGGALIAGAVVLGLQASGIPQVAVGIGSGPSASFAYDF